MEVERRRTEEREEGGVCFPSRDKEGTSGNELPRMSSDSEDDEMK
jgi:hypothetical protein